MKLYGLRCFKSASLFCLSAVLAYPFGVQQASGVDSYWNNTTGGNFTTPANWSGGMPGAGDNANFTSNATYQVTWTAPAANSRANFGGGTVTQAIGGFSWLLTNSYAIAPTGGGTGTVVHSWGASTVTNNAGDATLFIGQSGKGRYILNGGTVTTDYLFATNNGTGYTNSTLAFNFGTLNTRRGAGFVTISTNFFALGNTPGQIATWNITGGSNYFVVDNTVANVVGNVAGSRGILNLSGPGTYLLAPLPYVGYYGSDCQLVVSDGASLRSSFFFLGFNLSGSNTLGVISGNGSVWTNTIDAWIGYSSHGNRLIITNGGRLRSGRTYIGYTLGSGDGNSALVTGRNSVWTNTGDLYVGGGGSGNQLTVEFGARVDNQIGYIGFGVFQSNNLASVNGIGSLWKNSGLIIGYSGTGHQLSINGGTVIATNLIVGRSSTAANSALSLNNGLLTVTNTVGSPGLLDVRRGTFTVSSGVVTADRVLFTNVAGSFAFNGGRVNTKGTTFTPGSSLTVGDGTSPATLNFVGGTHTFSGGLNISANASLVGTGTITGGIFNDGTLAPGNSAGSITINGDLQMSSNGELVFQIGGPTQTSQYDYLPISSGLFCGGNLRVALANNYTPSATNIFTLAQFAFSSGSFANALDGERLKTTDNRGSFLVNHSGPTLQLSDYQSTDTDGDGIEDSWATNYFGSTPLPNGTGVNDKFGDKDGDGMSNFAEFLAGTDPTNNASYLKLTSTIAAPNTFTIQFDTVPGRTYHVWYSTNLPAWTEVPVPGFEHPAPNVNRWTDDGILTGSPPFANAGQRFYTVSVE